MNRIGITRSRDRVGGENGLFGDIVKIVAVKKSLLVHAYTHGQRVVPEA